MPRNYYTTLGIKRDATDRQIKSAYRKLARKYHPDVNKSPDAPEKFKEATEAYEVLSDSSKRKMYDQFGHAGISSRPGGVPGAGQVRWSHPGGGEGFENFFGGGFMGMSLDEILQSLGSRRRRGPRKTAQSSPPRGEDLEFQLSLEFMQAIFGVTTSICIRQAGSDETIEVKIPPGVRNGAKVRVRGKGGQGAGGNGDLYIVCNVGDHPYFRREGDDIHLDLPISIVEATLGAKVDVPTVDSMMSVKIPPGTHDGQRLRLKGKGVPGAGGKSPGDQYIVVRIVPPTNVSDEAGELLRQFDRAQPFDPRQGLPWKSDRVS